jgi:hypothetical protein
MLQSDFKNMFVLKSYETAKKRFYSPFHVGTFGQKRVLKRPSWLSMTFPEGAHGSVYALR